MNGMTDDGTVFCTECGMVHDDATALNREQQEKIEDLHRDGDAKLRKIRLLEGEKRNAMRRSPKYEVAMRVLGRWQTLCARKVRDLEGNRRLENALARLRHHQEDDLNISVDGYLRVPYVVNGKRSPIGAPTQWYADAELIFRDEQHMLKGMDMARESVIEIPRTVLEQVPWRRVKEYNRRAILDFLSACFGAPVDFDNDGWLHSPCPSCDDGRRLECPVQMPPMGRELTYLAHCSNCGIADSQLLQLAGNHAGRRLPTGATVQLELLGA